MTQLSRLRLARVGAVMALSGLAVLCLMFLEGFFGGTLVLESGPHDPRAVPVTQLPDGEAFAFHQKSKGGNIPLVVRLDIQPGEGPITVVTRDWSHRFDSRFGPGLMELTSQRFTYAAGKRAHTGKPFKGVPTPASFNLHGLGGRYVREGVYDLAEGKTYYLLLPVDVGRHGDYYKVWVRRGRMDLLGFWLLPATLLLAAGMGLGLWFSRNRR